MSSPPDEFDIDLDLSSLDPLPTGSVLQKRPSRGASAGQNERREAGPAGVASDEPLVDAGRDLLCVNCYHRAGWAGTSSTTWLRRGVVARLLESVQLDLPDGFGLAVYDGWRSPQTVTALYDHFYGEGSDLEPGYLAPPSKDPDDPDNVDDIDPPPHLTGGAVDLTLSWRGTPLSLGTPFDEFTPRAHLTALESGPATLDRDLRRLLFTVMTEAGFAPYEQEWWHYSYGDRAWADHHGHAAPLYGATSPNR